MAKIPAAAAQAQLETIANKLSAGYTDSEIIKELRLSRRAFYSYKKKIFAIYGNIAAKKSEQSLELEADLLKDRYIRLYRSLELRISERTADLSETALAAEVAGYLATSIFRLEVEGLRARQGRSLALGEQKAARYIGNIQRGLSEPDYTSKEENDEDQGEPEPEPASESSANGTDSEVF